MLLTDYVNSLLVVAVGNRRLGSGLIGLLQRWLRGTGLRSTVQRSSRGMGMYYFFFSYSRDDNNDYLKLFYRDLKEAVRGRVGLKEVSFFDQSENEPGDHWESNLEVALSSARVFVAVATASYCRKKYCGKEWAAFENRLHHYSCEEKLPQVPPLLLPVLWIPPNEQIAPFPRQLQERHYHLGDPKAVSNAKGIQYLTMLKGRYKQEYVDFVEGLAIRIVQLAAKHTSFDMYSDVPKLADVNSPFHEQGQAVSLSINASESGGLKHVHFVYAAAAPSELRGSGRQDVNAYGDNGGAEWQPFFPEYHAIGAVAPQIASSDEMGMIPHELSLTRDLHQQVRKWELQRHLVVVVLDSWTAALQKYREALQLLDQQNYMNCGVLIPWNEHDPETKKSVAQLNDTLDNALPHRVRNKDPFLRRDISGIAQLRNELADLLTRLRAGVFNKLSTAQDFPHSAPKPSISVTESSDE